MMGLAFAACTPETYDDSALKEQINNLDERLTKVEESLATLELNVNGMKTLAEALKNGKFINSVQELSDKTGYTITFSDGTSIVIKHGEKGQTGATGAAGKDGVTPTITVKEVDGVLYWFINGQQGPSVYEAAPVFTCVDGILYVTYPGQEPQPIGALTGKSIFDSVSVNEAEGTVTFFLLGENGQAGDSFVLPLAAKFELVIDTKVSLASGATSVEIPYEVKGANATTVVDVLTVACDAVVEAEVIKVSNIAAGAQILVFADNGEGKTSIKKIVFEDETESFSVEEVDDVIPAEGGQVVVKGVSNIAFDVVVSAAWLTQVETKTAFELVFAAEANTVAEVRTAEISFVRKGTEEVLKTVTVAQAAAEQKAFAEKVWNIAAVFGGGADRNMTMDSEYVYVAQAVGGNGAIKAISIADPTQVKDVKVATKVSVSTNGTHAISCVRVFPNTDPAVNGGKDVLVASNLTTGDGTCKLTIYVWTNGIDADPNYFVIDSGTRRLGDKFTIKGTYQSGEFHFYDYNETGVIIRVAMTNGVAGLWGTPDLAYATGRYAMPIGVQSNIGECTIHPDTAFDGDGNPKAALVTTNTTAGFFTQTSGNAYAVSAWGTDPNLAQTFGYNFFEQNGKKYIAYVKVAADRNSAALNVIEDVNGAADFKGTLEAQKGLVTFPVDGVGNAGHGVADCATAVVDGVRYIAVQAQNMGVTLYRLN